MVATPMRLEDALRFNGYTIEPVSIPAQAITLTEGVLAVPAMLGSGLVWRGAGEPSSISSLHLTSLPVFDPAYRPVMLSLILDQFRTRRLAYSTPDQFGLALRRWGNLHLGPTSTINKWYRSGVVTLPLTTVELVREETEHENTTGLMGATIADTSSSSSTGAETSHGRNANSDFPQGIIGGNTDYATDATDSASQSNATGTGTLTGNQTRDQNTSGSKDSTGRETETGRNGKTVMELVAEQRSLFSSADELFLAEFDSLFLQVHDQPEFDRSDNPFSTAYRPGW